MSEVDRGTYSPVHVLYDYDASLRDTNWEDTEGQLSSTSGSSAGHKVLHLVPPPEPTDRSSGDDVKLYDPHMTSTGSSNGCTLSSHRPVTSELEADENRRGSSDLSQSGISNNFTGGNVGEDGTLNTMQYRRNESDASGGQVRGDGDNRSLFAKVVSFRGSVLSCFGKGNTDTETGHE